MVAAMVVSLMVSMTTTIHLMMKIMMTVGKTVVVGLYLWWCEGDGDCDDDGDGDYFYDKLVMVRTIIFAEDFGQYVGDSEDYDDDDRVKGWSVALKFYERGGCRIHDVWSTYLVQLQGKK